MTESQQNEAWQIEVNGQVYEASFAEMADWIADGALQPDDRVRRGNLRWIEARKVPTLVPFFNSKANGSPPPAVVISTTNASELAPDVLVEVAPQHDFATDDSRNSGVVVEHVVQPADNSISQNQQLDNIALDRCENHVDRSAVFVCQSCARPACRECVNKFGSSVAVCSVCGGLCKSKAELEADQRKEEFRSASIEQGFGFGDFFAAITYPLKFKASLFFGAVMFMFFSLGRLAAGFGDIYMFVAAIFSYMLANMLAFGILSNTIESFAQGKIGGNFMPTFDEFSLWDDVVHPFFLSIGVYISAFGPFIAVFLVGTYLVMSAVSSQAEAMKANLEQTPGTPYYNVRDTLNQSEQVKGILANSERLNQEHLDAQQSIENGQQPAVVDPEEENIQKVNKMMADSKRKELESVVGKTAETRAQESAAFTASLLKLSPPIVVIGFITFLWGMFYFPAACAVAGYTQSFAATVDPRVGLDTIKRLGIDYAKVLFMAFLMLVAFAAVSAVLSFVLAAFDMPGVGNLPAKAIESIVWFYLVIVFACLLGFMIFKSSDRLKLLT
jgi:hypothetical protein